MLEIYTDGACRGNPGPGGWAAILKYEQEETIIYGNESHTTNNRMELMAAIKALETLQSPEMITLYTDSQYLCKGMTSWLSQWKKKGWKNSQGETVKNLELWQALDKLSYSHRISWRWVKGHSGHKYNDRVDALANQAIDEL